MFVLLAAAVVCGLLLGLACMINPRSDSIAEILKSGSRVLTGRIGGQVRRVLVITETALAIVVVCSAGLFVQTVRNLNAVDAGFNRSRLVSFSLTLPPTNSDNIDRVREYQRILEQLRPIPGIAAATGMTGLPLENPLSSYQTDVANYTPPSSSPYPAVNYYERVMSGYFETMGIPILEAAAFNPAIPLHEGWSPS